MGAAREEAASTIQRGLGASREREAVRKFRNEEEALSSNRLSGALTARRSRSAIKFLAQAGKEDAASVIQAMIRRERSGTEASSLVSQEASLIQGAMRGHQDRIRVPLALEEEDTRSRLVLLAWFEAWAARERIRIELWSEGGSDATEEVTFGSYREGPFRHEEEESQLCDQGRVGE